MLLPALEYNIKRPCLNFGPVVTGLVGNVSVHNINIEVTGGIRDNSNLEEEANVAGDSGISSERQGTGDGVRIELRIGEKAIGHESEGKVHGTGLTGSNLTGRYRDLTDDFPPVLEES